MNADKIKEYARRLTNLDDEIAALQEDRRELLAEARTECGINVKEMVRWVRAERKDKVDDLIADLDESLDIGAALGHPVSSGSKVSANKAETPLKNSKKSPRGDGDGAVKAHQPGYPNQSARISEQQPLTAAEGVASLPSPTNQKAAPDPNHSPDTSDGDPTRKDGCSGAAPIHETAVPSAAVPPGADSDGMAVSDSPVSLPDPTLDGEGAGGTDPFEIPGFLRRIS